jgi:hypothetical protein
MGKKEGEEEIERRRKVIKGNRRRREAAESLPSAQRAHRSGRKSFNPF